MISPDQPGQALADGELNGGEVEAVVLPSARLAELGVDEREVLEGVELPAFVVLRCTASEARSLAGLLFRGRVRVAISLEEIPEASKAETLPAPPEETVDGGVVPFGGPWPTGGLP